MSNPNNEQSFAKQPLKKQMTYTGGMQSENPQANNQKNAHIINRTNSYIETDEFSNNEQTNGSNNESNLAKHLHTADGKNGAHHNHLGHMGNNVCLNNGLNTGSNLHRTEEIENLADEDLVNMDNQSDLNKSNLELFNNHSHLKRTLELENLNEINDE